MTTQDVSYDLAEQMLQLIHHSKASDVVIEIGGIPTDMEHNYLPSAFRFLELATEVQPKIALISTFDHTESDEPKIKTQLVRQAIRDTREKYGLDFRAVLIRRRRLPTVVNDDYINQEIETTAYETQIPKEMFVFVENVASPADLKQIIANAGLFKEIIVPPMVSQCGLNIPCRHDGKASTLDTNIASQLSGYPYINSFCPEKAAGFSVPRTKFEILGGDGDDVLNGSAKVIDSDGNDYSGMFILGAIETLKYCLKNGIKQAYLAPRSPSCGIGEIYNGSFNHELIIGNGVTASLLNRWGIKCVPLNH